MLGIAVWFAAVGHVVKVPVVADLDIVVAVGALEDVVLVHYVDGALLFGFDFGSLGSGGRVVDGEVGGEAVCREGAGGGHGVAVESA